MYYLYNFCLINFPTVLKIVIRKPFVFCVQIVKENLRALSKGSVVLRVNEGMAGKGELMDPLVQRRE